MKSRTAKPEMATAQALRALRALVVRMPDGTFIGSEANLIEQIGVSRATLRQAVKLLEHEQLLTVRRGPGGGFYARRPTVDIVSHAASVYLQDKYTVLADVVPLINLLTVEACRLAALCSDETRRLEMTDLINDFESRLNIPQTVSEHLEDELRYISLLCSMASSPAMELFLHITYDFTYPLMEYIFAQHAERMLPRRQGRISICRAVLAGRGDLASSLCRQQTKFFDTFTAGVRSDEIKALLNKEISVA